MVQNKYIYNNILYVGSKGAKNLYSLFDSGANLSCINPSFLNQLQTPVQLGKTRQLSTASEGHYIEVSQAVRLDFYIGNVLLSDEFLVVPALSQAVIIGAATMQKWRIKLNFENHTAGVNPNVAKLILKNLI